MPGWREDVYGAEPLIGNIPSVLNVGRQDDDITLPKLIFLPLDDKVYAAVNYYKYLLALVVVGRKLETNGCSLYS